MVRQITKENIERFGFSNEGDNRENLPLSEDVQQTLSRLIAWDNDSERWELVRSDTDGRLLVSSGSTKATSNVSSNPAPTTTVANILTANTSRKDCIIQNVGTIDVYLGFGEDATTSDGFLLEAGNTWIEDVWIGRISAITASGVGDLHVQDRS